MLKKQVVSSEMFNIIKILQSNSLFDNHVLAGGTALAFQIGHRISTDMDLFTSENQNALQLMEFFRKTFKKVDIASANDSYLQIFINNIKIEIVHDDYAMVRNPVIEDNIRMFDKSEISAMKIRAIQGRTKARDFIDLAYLLQELSLKNMFEIYKEKYGSISEKMIKRTMLTKCKSIKNNEWLVDIKMLRNDIKPEDVLKCIEKGIEDYNKDNNIGKSVT